MMLYELLEGLQYDRAPANCEIASVTTDSRQVRPGTLFVCIQGENADGHTYAAKAAAAGAAAVVCQRDLGLGCQVLVESTFGDSHPGSGHLDKLVAAAVQKINGLRWGLLCFDPDISQQKDCKQQVKKKTEIKEDHAGYGTGTPDMIKNLQVKGDEVDVQDDQKI